MNKIISIIFISLAGVSFAFGATPSGIKTIDVTYDKNEHATITVTMHNKSSTETLSADSNKEREIVTQLIEEYNLTREEVMDLTTFRYPKVNPKHAGLNKTATVHTRVHKGMTIMTITDNGTVTDYWIKTTNVRVAAQELAHIYKVRTRQILAAITR